MEKQVSMKFLIALISVICSAVALAQSDMTLKQFDGLDDFHKVEFLDAYAKEETFSGNEYFFSRAELSVFAQSKAEIWLDTILEGDFAQNGDAEVVSISAFTYKGEIYAYEIEIAASALMTSSETCLYNEQTETWSGSGCVKGRIVEKALATKNLEPIWSSQFPEFIEEL